MEQRRTHKNVISVEYKPSGIITCRLSRPIPCDMDWFIDAFWMPIKHQLGDKLILYLISKDGLEFSLFYNQAAALGVAINHPTKEQIEQYKADAKKSVDIALSQISRILDHIYLLPSKNGAKTIPFLDVDCIHRVDGNTIQMNGRLPMQEEYFVKKYWTTIRKQYHAAHPGVQFRLFFSDDQTTITVDAKCHRINARRQYRGLPELNGNDIYSNVTDRIVNDLLDAVVMAANEYLDACQKFDRQQVDLRTKTE